MPDLTKLAPKTAGMSDEQYAYALARAAYEAARDKAREETDLLLIPTEDVGDAWLDDHAAKILAINAKYKLSDLLSLLREAEDLLIEWAKRSMQKHRPKDFHKIALAFDMPLVTRKLMKPKLVDICFRYHEPEGGKRG